ncbi:type I-E CRISPR-associated protein Cas6/Cse3/CasE [Methylomonas koyamae]|nr:type I-E CRISPR-associated protein Cas6/Cse3/CasE [Methylomonas koyamae]WNB74750.1 type I-E CRISPR-associated protein Cas6/Cse3/CasE [Methylomonas koyamae]
MKRGASSHAPFMCWEAKMYFSRLRVAPNQLPQFAKLSQYNHYQLHQILWQLFRDKPEEERDFLFRQDTDSYGLPIFYLLSKYQPQHEGNTWLIETKPFQPTLKAGDLLSFSLRANPVEQVKLERSESEQLEHAEQRKANGLPEKQTKKRIHHDVVMQLKKSLSDEERQSYSQAELEQQAGEKWLNERAEKNGFRVLSVTAQGYQQHHFKKRQIKISTLDFTGELQITDPEKFRQTLFTGLGRAKAFGCGLLMVRRL